MNKSKMTFGSVLFSINFGLCSSLTAEPNLEPPVATVANTVLTKHGDSRTDPYSWLNKRDTREVLDYLSEENEYTSKFMAPHKRNQNFLFKEMMSRYQEDEESASYYKNGYFYFTKVYKETSYPRYYRKKGPLNGKEELLLDVNKLAEYKEYTSVRSVKVSPNNDYLAYGLDHQGRRNYKIKFKSLVSGDNLNSEIAVSNGNFVWTADSQHIYYIKQDQETLRASQLFLFSIKDGTSQKVFEEKDPSYSLRITKSKTDRFLFLRSESTDSNETRYLKTSNIRGQWKVFSKRRKDLKYYLKDGLDKFFLLTNHESSNYKIAESPIAPSNPKKWKTIIEHSSKRYITDMDVFKSHLVYLSREKTVSRVYTYNRKKRKKLKLSFSDPTHRISFNFNPIYDSNTFRLNFESLSKPKTVFEYKFGSKHKVMIHQRSLPNDYNPDNYISKRVFAKAKDGSKIPMSIIYKKGLKRDGQNPAIIQGYGAYGITIEPHFDRDRISLLDRGFVFAIAHVRGGSMKGKSWYNGGRLSNKVNSFTDFIDCSRYLIINSYTNKKQLYARGGSAGGLLVSAAMNMRPTLYNGVIAHVPFVDVVTTMLDESIPLTTGEFKEWGNPKNRDHYEYMKSYSPYDNIKKQDYPNLLVTAAYHDSQVQYWEPAKLVAKIRSHHTGDNTVLLKTNMSAGHGGASGRDGRLKERALEYSFIFAMENMRAYPQDKS